MDELSLFTRWAVWPTVASAALGFIAFAAILSPAEWLCGRRDRPPRRLLTDLLFWVFTPLVGKAVILAAVTTIVGWLLGLVGRELDMTSTEGWGLVGGQPLWLQAAEALLLADLIFYWTHRMFHVTRLWPFHAVHHSPEHLDWLSSMRTHPVNDAVSRVAQAVPLVLLGFAPAAVLAVIPVAVVFVILAHADVPWAWGPLRRVLVSPVYHHWHHSSESEAVDRNFAGVFVLWDWLFDTMYMPAGRIPTRYGVVGGNTPHGFLALLLYPFRVSAGRSGLTVTGHQVKGTDVANPVEVWVQDNRTGKEVTLLLGEFREVWDRGVTIGSSTECDVVLDDPAVAPSQATLRAVSNHKYLRVLHGGAVRARGEELPAGADVRVDSSTFEVGCYSLRLPGAGC